MNNLNSHVVSQKANIYHPIKGPQLNITLNTGVTETHHKSSNFMEARVAVLGTKFPACNGNNFQHCTHKSLPSSPYPKPCLQSTSCHHISEDQFWRIFLTYEGNE